MPANSIPLSNAKYKLWSKVPVQNKKVIPIYHEITIANPPPTGIGNEWELLSFGISRILFLEE